MKPNVQLVQETPSASRNAALALWLGVAAAFLLLASAWFAMFTVARAAGVQSVPLAIQGRKGS